MNDLPTSHPLAWPRGWKRTAPSDRVRGRFGDRQGPPSVMNSVRGLQDEIRRMRAAQLIVSTNVPLRADGFPRSDARKLEDPGAAVYFERDGKLIALACDGYVSVEANLRAIVLHIGALRAIERYGVGSLDQAFAGYAALPENGSEEPWWSVLGLPDPPRTLEALEAVFRVVAKRTHPDTGGSAESFDRARKAYQLGIATLAHNGVES